MAEKYAASSLARLEGSPIRRRILAAAPRSIGIWATGPINRETSSLATRKSTVCIYSAGRNPGITDPGKNTALIQVLLFIHPEVAANHHRKHKQVPDHLVVYVVNVVVAVIIDRVEQSKVKHSHGNGHITEISYPLLRIPVDELYQEIEQHIKDQNGGNKVIMGRIDHQFQNSFDPNSTIQPTDQESACRQPDRRIHAAQPLDIPLAETLLRERIQAVAGDREENHITQQSTAGQDPDGVNILLMRVGYKDASQRPKKYNKLIHMFFLHPFPLLL